MVNLEELHNCPQSRNKIVCISVDKLGVTRCGYCDSVVQYGLYHNELYKDNILQLVEELKLKREEHNQWLKQKKNLKRKKRRKM